jgi:uncharacterized protein
MKEFVEFIVKHLVDYPDEVEVFENVQEDQKTMNYSLQVNSADVGKVIGKKGKTIESMRVLLGAIAAKNGKKATLEIKG